MTPAPTTTGPNWDPTRPLLAALTEQMERLDAPLTTVDMDGTQLIGRDGSRSRLDITLDDLLDEQVDPAQRTVAALAGDQTDYRFPLTSRMALFYATHPLAEPRPIAVSVRVYWREAKAHLHVPPGN